MGAVSHAKDLFFDNGVTILLNAAVDRDQLIVHPETWEKIKGWIDNLNDRAEGRTV